ncbi:MAG: PIG-L family deacetylase [Acidobacteriota bacterium]|nr:MAG: PIG-L family deacetylase [Acidobacteriota bacterium]
MRKLLITLLFVSCALGSAAWAADEPLRIIAVFAHPDDADSRMAGTAIQWAKMGHQVKFVSITNGDAGHFETGGARLAQRRRAESEEAARRYGIAEYKTLDNHDAELVPSLDVRKQVIREIREWKADIVLGLRPNDYHPDHRYAGVLVMDAAYMVVVPNSVSDVPALEKNPVFLYMRDRFTRPYPFQPHITVIIDDVFDQKIDGQIAHESQYFEWLPWVDRILDEVPKDPAARREWFIGWRGKPNINDEMRKNLEKWYGAEKAQKAVHAEAFEIAEYGYQPSEEEIRKMFPMLGQ